MPKRYVKQGARLGTVCRIRTVLNPCAAIRAPIQFSSFACYQVSAALLKTRHVLIGRVGPSSPMLWGRPQPRVMQRPLVRVARDFLADQLLGAIGCSRSCQEVSPPQLRPRRTQSLFLRESKNVAQNIKLSSKKPFTASSNISLHAPVEDLFQAAARSHPGKGEFSTRLQSTINAIISVSISKTTPLAANHP